MRRRRSRHRPPTGGGGSTAGDVNGWPISVGADDDAVALDQRAVGLVVQPTWAIAGDGERVGEAAEDGEDDARR